MKIGSWLKGIYFTGLLILIFKYMSYFTFESIGGDESNMGTAIWTGIEDEGWIWIIVFFVYGFAGLIISLWYNYYFVEGDGNEI